MRRCHTYRQPLVVEPSHQKRLFRARELAQSLEVAILLRLGRRADDLKGAARRLRARVGGGLRARARRQRHAHRELRLGGDHRRRRVRRRGMTRRRMGRATKRPEAKT